MPGGSDGTPISMAMERSTKRRAMARAPRIAERSAFLRQRPKERDQRGPEQDDEQRERRAQPGVVAEAIPARAHDQRVALVADRREEIAAGSGGDGHQEGVRS